MGLYLFHRRVGGAALGFKQQLDEAIFAQLVRLASVGGGYRTVGRSVCESEQTIARSEHGGSRGAGPARKQAYHGAGRREAFCLARSLD